MHNCHSKLATRNLRATVLLAVAVLVSGPTTALAQLSFEELTFDSDYGSNLFAAPCDLDEDGWTDMLVTDRDNDRLVWLRNRGDTSFDEIPLPDTDGYLTYPYVADLDEDGDMDILGAKWTFGTAHWWENDGDERFTIRPIGSMPGGHRTISVDIDEDGDLDVAACGLDGGCGNRWFENDGSEGFTEYVLSTDRCSHCVDHGDFDDDGNIDLVTTDRAVGLVVWWNDGEENFSETTIAFPYAHWVLTDDIDQDGDPDLVAVGYNPSEVAWWENDGAGSFTKHSISTTFSGPLVVDVGDLDEDGDRDVTAAGVNEHEVSWWENDGSESFTEHPLTGAGYINAESVQVADLDGDSDADLVCAGAGQPCVRWFESNIVDIVPTTDLVTGVAPLDVTFSDSSTAWYPITERLWDCDYDGVMDASGDNPVWAYEEPGTHSVLLELRMGERTGRALLLDHVEAFDTGSALWFDGSGGHVDCPSSPSAALTGPMTVEAWIRPYDWGGFPVGSFGFGQILEKGSVSLFLTGTHPARNDHGLYLELVHGDATVSGTCSPVESIELDEWQHVAVTYNGASDVRMWIDGVEQTVTYTVAPSGNLGANGAVTIGNIAGTLNRAFEGEIDEVRLWNVARGESDIQDGKDRVLSGSEPGLVGYWALDEGNGSLAGDGSASGSDGAVTDALWVQGVVLYATGLAENGDDDMWADKSPRIASFPNPFARTTSLNLTLPRPSDVRVTVYDLAGRVVKEITELRLDAGAHVFEWDGRNSYGEAVATGVYFCKATGEGVSTGGKLVLLR